MTTPFSLRFYESVDHLKATIDTGITSVRDAGGADLGVKTAVESGLVTGPRMQISVTILSITGGHVDGWMPSNLVLDVMPGYPGMPVNICDGLDQVRKKVREVLRAGADVVKICATGGILSPTDDPHFIQFSPEEIGVIVQEAAYRKGTKVMAHAQGSEGIKNAVRAGVHSIEHGIFMDQEGIEMMLENGTFLVPTLLAGVAVMENAESSGSMPDYALRKAREVMDVYADNIGRAYKAGVKIAMGTDAGVFRHGMNLRELGLMVEVGMSPMEAIIASTKTAAECLGWQDRVGTLEPGKLADLIIVAGDPLADIRCLENQDNIQVVMKDGRILKDIREPA
jgi:imidazolonepropionase-like amidohydrolase